VSHNKDMGDTHEAFLVDLFGGKQARGSGNQWRQPMDGRTSRKHLRFAFAWDGKSTLGKSLTVPLLMIRKAKEQAGGNRPMIALRWYDSEQPFALRPVEDWVAVKAQDMAELLTEANALAALEKEMDEEGAKDFLMLTVSSIREVLAKARAE
jgi:hypothetical protein